MRLKQKFVIFLILNFVIWSCVALLRHSLPMDTQEAIVWGKYCLWGTTKHPPLSGWIAYSFWTLFQYWDGAMYVLSQIFVVIGIFYIYKLAREFIDETLSILAAMLQFGIIFYNFSTPEFNVNIIAIALWPMSAYYFWRAYRKDRWSDWLLFAIATALNLLNKYIAILLLFALAIFVLLSPKRKQILKNYKAYSAAFLCLLLLAPHLWWLYDHDFETFNYISARNKEGNIVSWWRHIFYPVKFLGAQILFTAATWLTYSGFYIKSEKIKSTLNAIEQKYLLIISFVPVLTMAFIGIITGNPLKSMWTFPMFFSLGIIFIGILSIKIDQKKAQKIFYIMASWSVLFAIGYTSQCLLTRSERFHSNCPQIVKLLESKWNEKNQGKPLEYIGSNEWYAHMVSLYGSHEIKPIIWLSLQSNPWFEADDFYEKGALIIANNLDEYRRYMKKFPQQISQPQTLNLEFKNYFGKTKNKEIYYGFYHSQGGENAKE